VNREKELSILARQSFVDRCECVQFRFHVRLILLIQIHFEDLGVVKTNAGSLRDYLCGIDEVLKDGTMDGCEGAAAGSLLSLDAIVSPLFGQNLSVGDDDDALAAELLFQFPDEADVNPVESLQEDVRHEEDDGLLPAGDVHLLRRRDIEVVQFRFDLVRGDFEVVQCLGHRQFKGIGLLSLFLDDLLPKCEHLCLSLSLCLGLSVSVSVSV